MKTQDAIQHKIRLDVFKAVSAELKCIDEPPDGNFKDEFNLELKNILFADSDNHFGKAFILDVAIHNPDQKEVVYVKTEFHTIFECDEDVNEEFLSSQFVRVAAPAIGFPYLRAFVSNLSLSAGYNPIILPSINFVKFDQDNQ